MKPKRSNQQKISLVLAGALVAGMVGCSDGRRRPETNNTYVTDRGYYHSETGGWYPYPWNHYVPGVGYYGGSRGWTGTPHRMVNGIRSVPVNRPVYYAPAPNIPVPPPPRVYTAPTTRPSVAPSRPATPSKPTSGFSSGARTGGFGSSAGSSSGS